MTALLLPGVAVPRAAALRGLACRASVRVCLLLAALLLGTARSLFPAGLIGPRSVHLALTWASRLTHVGLRAWRIAERCHRSR